MWAPSVLTFSAFTILIAAFVRGYSGFGFAMIGSVSLSLVLPPAEVVPAIILLDVTAGASLLPQVWRRIEWRSLSWLTLGALLTTPIGAYFLASIPAKYMRGIIAVLVLALVTLLTRGFSLRQEPGKVMSIAAGLVSGLFNGSAAIGGPPAILFYFSSPAGAAVSRASLIAYFMGIDIIALGTGLSFGLITLNTLYLCAILLCPLLLGLVLGSRCFLRSDPEVFRSKVLRLLMILSCITLIRAALE